MENNQLTGQTPKNVKLQTKCLKILALDSKETLWTLMRKTETRHVERMT